MPLSDPAFWSEHLRRTLQRYDEPLLRLVAGKLLRPRGQWPVDELIERCVATVNNAAVIDRRVQELDATSRRLLALIGHSRQPCWQVGHLLQMLVTLGWAEVAPAVFTLLEAGLLYPVYTDLFAAEGMVLPGVPPSRGVLARGTARLRGFELLRDSDGIAAHSFFAHPLVTARALGKDEADEGKSPITDWPPSSALCHLPAASVQEADGLEWPLRLAALWQQVSAGPLRWTQQGDFFKRDLDRLRADPLLNAAPADSLTDLPDAALLTVALARIEGILQEEDGELRAAPLPDWEQGLAATLASLWAALPLLASWNPGHGWAGNNLEWNPYPSAYLVALLLVSRLPPDAWIAPAALERWMFKHHPYWSVRSERQEKEGPLLSSFLLGLAYQLRLVQAAKNARGEWVVRLSPLGRWLLGLAEAPAAPPVYTQTLLVQPNLEILVYRQGLTPGLIARLSRFGVWKSFGAACTLQLQPNTVYRALEAGETFETIVQTLERHGMKPTPPAVLDSLRTWSNKRERIAIYPAAALFEFASAQDLSEALARGLPGLRLTERLAVVAKESDVDFRHFRLSGTRDYSLPPERCVEVEPDGVTLSVDTARSDLLLEMELQRFAESVDRTTVNGRRVYRLTPASLDTARRSGLSLQTLETWFSQRSSTPLSAAARFLMSATQIPALEIRRQLVLQVADEELADGLQQWPGTRSLIQGRLGPTALVVAEEDTDELLQRLRTLGVSVTLSV
jgi:hypothetical protein